MRERQLPHQESADRYVRIVLAGNSHRVIVCKDERQWIIQIRRGGRWENLTYHLARPSLLRDWRRATGEDVAERFARFPEKFAVGSPPYVPAPDNGDATTDRDHQEARCDE